MWGLGEVLDRSQLRNRSVSCGYLARQEGHAVALHTFPHSEGGGGMEAGGR